MEQLEEDLASKDKAFRAALSEAQADMRMQVLPYAPSAAPQAVFFFLHANVSRLPQAEQHQHLADQRAHLERSHHQLCEAVATALQSGAISGRIRQKLAQVANVSADVLQAADAHSRAARQQKKVPQKALKREQRKVRHVKRWPPWQPLPWGHPDSWLAIDPGLWLTILKFPST